MKFMIYTHDKDNSLDIRKANRKAHLAYIKNHEKVKIIGVGPWLDDTSGDMKGSLLVVEANCINCITAWIENDPYVLAGLPARASIHPLGGWMTET